MALRPAQSFCQIASASTQLTLRIKHKPNDANHTAHHVRKLPARTRSRALWGMGSAFFGFRMDPRFPEEEKSDLGGAMRGVVAGKQLFQRFTLRKVLGHGAMSVVWLALEDRMERLVALKLVPESASFGPAACEDLKHETQKSLVLTHANIVRIFDFIADEGIAAISMEYVDGTTLSEARRQKRSKCFGIPELAPWVASLCDALAYAHESAGLIHRDLSPANILVDSRAKLKITNFGIACSLRNSRSRASGQISPGTMNYMSPQQMRGEEPLPSDDIYALGVTLYEMLSSKPPFYNGDVALQVREMVAPPIAQRRVTLGIAGEPIPKRWEETIAACLAKDPGQRPQSAAEVAERLRLGGTVRLTTAREIAKPVFERYLKVGALAVATAALATAALISYRSNLPAPRPNAGPPFKPASPAGYAIESPIRRVPAANMAEPPRTLGPMAAPQNATLQLATSPAGASFAIYPGVVANEPPPDTTPVRTGATPESVGDLPPGQTRSSFITRGGLAIARKSRCSRGRLVRSNTPSLMAALRSPAPRTAPRYLRAKNRSVSPR